MVRCAVGSVRKHEGTGLLFIDFRHKGIRCREQTALPDTSANRKKVQKLLNRIEVEMSAGTFDYRRFFPGSKHASKFDNSIVPSQLNGVALSLVNALAQEAGQPLAGAVGTPLLKDFTETWFSEKEVEWRRSHKKVIRADLDGRIIPRWGDCEVGRIVRDLVMQQPCWVFTLGSTPLCR